MVQEAGERDEAMLQEVDRRTSATDPEADAPPTTTRPDVELLEAVRQGDPGAFGEVYRRHEPVVRRFCRSLVPADEVDDLVAETFTKVFSAIRAGKGPVDHPERYLMVAARSTAMTFHRRRAQAKKTADVIAQQPVAHPEGPEAHDAALAAAMASLTPRWRQVIWWSTVDGLAPTEIGARLGLSTAAVASLTYRARGALRSAYEAALEGPPAS